MTSQTGFPYRDEESEEEDSKDYYDPKYVSLSLQINSNGRSVNEKNLEKLLEIMNKSKWVETKNFDDIYLGDRFRYIRKDINRFVTGGWLAIKEKDHVMWRSHNHKLWSLQKNNIKRMWYKKNANRVKQEEKKEKIVKFNKPIEEGKYTVTLDDVVIYRTNDKSKYEKFMSTDKYKYAEETGKFEIV